MAPRQPPDHTPDRDPVLRSSGWLRPGMHLLVGLVVTAMGLYFSYNTYQNERARDFSQRQSQVQRELSDFRARLETNIYGSVALVRGLAVQVVLHDGISEEEFQAIAAELLREQPDIINLSLAPGFVIGSIYPLPGNEAALGLRLLDDPVQKHAVLHAIREDTPVLAGPFEMVQGGQALAVRIPLWVDVAGVPRLWGAVSMTLDHERLLRRAGLPALEKDLRLDIVGRDAGGPGGALIQGPRLPASLQAVKTPVFLPGGSWLISAVPRDGWYQSSVWRSPDLLVRLLMSLLAGLAISRILHDAGRIRHLAGRDMLTSLPNRRWALQQLHRLISRGKRGGDGFALLSFDLDGFKPVNDTYGHAAGDRLLAEIGRRLGEAVRPGDVVARMGGDEFLVLVPVDPSMGEDWLRAMALRVQAAINRPVAIDEHWVVVGASIGVARFPEDGDDAGVLLRKADEAMYRAKAGRAQGVEFAAPTRLGLMAPAD